MADREFRKIPSLQFLYEVNEDGRIFRNVKSKNKAKLSWTIIILYQDIASHLFV